MASRRARYTLRQVLKHILEEGSESENESSEDKEGAERFIHSDVPNAGPGMEPQALARGASFGVTGDIRIFNS